MGSGRKVEADTGDGASDGGWAYDREGAGGLSRHRPFLADARPACELGGRNRIIYDLRPPPLAGARGPPRPPGHGLHVTFGWVVAGFDSTGPHGTILGDADSTQGCS